MAVYAGHAQVVELLLRHGADTAVPVPLCLMEQDLQVSTLLHLACAAKRPDIDTVCTLLNDVMEDQVEARDAKVSSTVNCAVI